MNNIDNNEKIANMILHYFEIALDESKYYLANYADENYFHITIANGDISYLIHKGHPINDDHLNFVFNHSGYKVYSDFKIDYDADNLLDVVGEINMDKLTEIAYRLAPPQPRIKSAYKK